MKKTNLLFLLIFFLGTGIIFSYFIYTKMRGSFEGTIIFSMSSSYKYNGEKLARLLEDYLYINFGYQEKNKQKLIYKLTERKSLTELSSIIRVDFTTKNKALIDAAFKRLKTAIIDENEIYTVNKNYTKQYNVQYKAREYLILQNAVGSFKALFKRHWANYYDERADEKKGHRKEPNYDIITLDENSNTAIEISNIRENLVNLQILMNEVNELYINPSPSFYNEIKVTFEEIRPTKLFDFWGHLLVIIFLFFQIILYFLVLIMKKKNDQKI